MAEGKSKLPKILAIVGCAVLLSIGGCVACVGGLAYFGMGEAEKEFCRMLADNEVIVEHIGANATCDLSLESFAAVEENGYLELGISGDKGSGKVQIQVQGQGNQSDITGGTLTLDDGRSFDLVPPESEVEGIAEEVIEEVAPPADE